MKKLLVLLSVFTISSQCFAMIGSRVHCVSKDNTLTIDIDSDARTLAVNYGSKQDPGYPATVINYGVKLYADTITGFVVNVYDSVLDHMAGTLQYNSGEKTPLICKNVDAAENVEQ